MPTTPFSDGVRPVRIVQLVHGLYGAIQEPAYVMLNVTPHPELHNYPILLPLYTMIPCTLNRLFPHLHSTRAPHLSVLMTLHNFSTQYYTEKSSHNLPSYVQSSDVVYRRKRGRPQKLTLNLTLIVT